MYACRYYRRHSSPSCMPMHVLIRECADSLRAAGHRTFPCPALLRHDPTKALAVVA